MNGVYLNALTTNRNLHTLGYMWHIYSTNHSQSLSSLEVL